MQKITTLIVTLLFVVGFGACYLSGEDDLNEVGQAIHGVTFQAFTPPADAEFFPFGTNWTCGYPGATEASTGVCIPGGDYNAIKQACKGICGMSALDPAGPPAKYPGTTWNSLGCTSTGACAFRDGWN